MHNALATLVALCPQPADLPDLDKIREFLRRVQELLVMGGVALSAAASAVFLIAWALSHLRGPRAQGEGRPWLSTITLVSSYVPVGLTAVAALGMFLPFFAPFILKSFALAVVLAGFSWCLAIGTIIAGGDKSDLSRARKALMLAGTPWYCLVVYLATFL